MIREQDEAGGPRVPEATVPQEAQALMPQGTHAQQIPGGESTMSPTAQAPTTHEVYVASAKEGNTYTDKPVKKVQLRALKVKLEKPGTTHEAKAEMTPTVEAPKVHEVCVPAAKEGNAPSAMDFENQQFPDKEFSEPTQTEINCKRNLQKALETKEARNHKFREMDAERTDRAYRSCIASGHVTNIDHQFTEKDKNPEKENTRVNSSRENASRSGEEKQFCALKAKQERPNTTYQVKVENTHLTRYKSLAARVTIPAAKVSTSAAMDSKGSHSHDKEVSELTQAEINFNRKLQKVLEAKEAQNRKFREMNAERANRAHRNRLASGRLAYIEFQFTENIRSPKKDNTSVATCQQSTAEYEKEAQLHALIAKVENPRTTHNAKAENTRQSYEAAGRSAVAPVSYASRQEGSWMDEYSRKKEAAALTIQEKARLTLEAREAKAKRAARTRQEQEDSMLVVRQEAPKTGVSVKEAQPRIQLAQNAKMENPQLPPRIEVTPWGLVRVIVRRFHVPASHCRTMDIIINKKAAAARTMQEKARLAQEVREAKAESVARVRHEQRERLLQKSQEKERLTREAREARAEDTARARHEQQQRPMQARQEQEDKAQVRKSTDPDVPVRNVPHNATAQGSLIENNVNFIRRLINLTRDDRNV